MPTSKSDSRELSRSGRYGHPLTLAVIDADRFKSLNDNHGHSAGDMVLRKIAELLRDSCRQSDTAARYGDAPAITDEDGTITFRQLDETSNALARQVSWPKRRRSRRLGRTKVSAPCYAARSTCASVAASLPRRASVRFSRLGSRPATVA